MIEDADKEEELDEDAEESTEEGEDGEEVKPIDEGKGGFNVKKIVLFVVLPLFLLAGGGAAAYFTGALDGLLGKEDAHAEDGEHAEKDGDGKDDKNAGPAYFLEVPDLVVNLNSEDGKSQRYLRLNIQLEVASEEDKAAIEAVMPRVIDQFQTYLRELRIRDLQGSAGIYRLQAELLSRVNRAAAPTEVKDVLFQEILIQ